MNKFVNVRPFADPLAAAPKLLEIANGVEAVQDGRIFIELINGPFSYEHKGSPAEYGAAQARDRTRLAMEARERHLCEAHTIRCRPFRLIAMNARSVPRLLHFPPPNLPSS